MLDLGDGAFAGSSRLVKGSLLIGTGVSVGRIYDR